MKGRTKSKYSRFRSFPPARADELKRLEEKRLDMSITKRDDHIEEDTIRHCCICIQTDVLDQGQLYAALITDDRLLVMKS